MESMISIEDLFMAILHKNKNINLCTLIKLIKLKKFFLPELTYVWINKTLIFIAKGYLKHLFLEFMLIILLSLIFT